MYGIIFLGSENKFKEMILMSNYNEKRDARVNLAHILEKAGFRLYGYKPDQSDMMVDYYNPADWDGIATKGQYIAVVDNKGKNGLEIIVNSSELLKYNQKVEKLTFQQKDKIDKLKRLADKTTFEGEKENALEKIERLLSNIENNDIESVETVKEYLDFPATNYMFFIWDTEAKGIIYKTMSLTDWNINDLKYNRDLEWKDSRLIDTTDYSRSKFYYNGETYTKEKLDGIKEKNNKVITKVNNFINEMEKLDGLKTCYRFGEVSKHKKSLDFENIEINNINDIEKNRDNLYCSNWGNEKYKLIEIKEVQGYYKDIVKKATFKKIKKDGSFYAKSRELVVSENDIYSFKNRTFFIASVVNAKAWRSEKRAILLETDVKATTEATT